MQACKYPLNYTTSKSRYMIGFEAILIAFAVGTGAFFLGSTFSPMARVYKKSVAEWQGLYSRLRAEMNKLEAHAEENDPLVQLASQFGIDPKLAKSLVGNPVVQQMIQNFIQKNLGQRDLTKAFEEGQSWR